MLYEIRSNNTIVDPDTEEVLGNVPTELCELFDNAQDLLQSAQVMFGQLCHVKLNPTLLQSLMQLGRSITDSGGSAGFWSCGVYHQLRDLDKAEKVLVDALKERTAEEVIVVSEFLGW